MKVRNGRWGSQLGLGGLDRSLPNVQLCRIWSTFDLPWPPSPRLCLPLHQLEERTCSTCQFQNAQYCMPCIACRRLWWELETISIPRTVEFYDLQKSSQVEQQHSSMVLEKNCLSCVLRLHRAQDWCTYFGANLLNLRPDPLFGAPLLDLNFPAPPCKRTQKLTSSRHPQLTPSKELNEGINAGLQFDICFFILLQYIGLCN